MLSHLADFVKISLNVRALALKCIEGDSSCLPILADALQDEGYDHNEELYLLRNCTLEEIEVKDRSTRLLSWMCFWAGQEPPNINRVTQVEFDMMTGESIYVSLPVGWCRVWEGIAQKGDKFLNRMHHFEVGEIRFDPIKLDKKKKDNSVNLFNCVIRRGIKDVGKPCQSCGFRYRSTVMDDDYTDEPVAICWQCLRNLPDVDSDLHEEG